MHFIVHRMKTSASFFMHREWHYSVPSWPISVQNLRSSAKKIHKNFVGEALVNSARWREGDWRSHGSAAGTRGRCRTLGICNPKPCLVTQNLQTEQAQQSSIANVQSMPEPYLKCGSELDSPGRKYLRTSPPCCAEMRGQCHPLHLCDQDLWWAAAKVVIDYPNPLVGTG